MAQRRQRWAGLAIALLLMSAHGQKGPEKALASEEIDQEEAALTAEARSASAARPDEGAHLARRPQHEFSSQVHAAVAKASALGTKLKREVHLSSDDTAKLEEFQRDLHSLLEKTTSASTSAAEKRAAKAKAAAEHEERERLRALEMPPPAETVLLDPNSALLENVLAEAAARSQPLHDEL